MLGTASSRIVRAEDAIPNVTSAAATSWGFVLQPNVPEPFEAFEAIQRAYYLEAQNPSDDETLIARGDAIGLDRERYAQALIDPATQAELLRQIEFAARLGARGFPSLFLEDERGYRPVAFDYNDPAVVLNHLGLRILRT